MAGGAAGAVELAGGSVRLCAFVSFLFCCSCAVDSGEAQMGAEVVSCSRKKRRVFFSFFLMISG